MMSENPPRLWLMDDNVIGAGGHFLELASLLAGAANERGYSSQLVVHESFDENDSALVCDPVFRVRRMTYWSLGVDGRSRVSRNTLGEPIGGTRLERAWHRLGDPLSRRNVRPATMLQRWSEDFQRLVRQWNPQPHDRIVINTGDDFQLLALSRALSELNLAHPLTIHVILHFALYEGAEPSTRAKLYGEQVNAVLRRTNGHLVHLHATTEPLTRQLGAVGVKVTPIPYPIRPPASGDKSGDNLRDNLNQDQRSLKIVLAGMPRAEKGRGQMKALLSEIWSSHLETGDFSIAMQMPRQRWQRMIPMDLRGEYRRAMKNEGNDAANRLEIHSGDLDAESYNRFLDSADVGLFLYDPQRYVARCSGVLLEMFIRGVPVIVPKGCWLSEQLDLAGGDGVIGYSYQSIEQIPQLLRQVRREYSSIRQRAALHARKTCDLHNASNTLRAMGVPDLAAFALRAS